MSGTYNAAILPIIADCQDEADTAQVWLDETVDTLTRALTSYHITATLRSARLTPNAALVRYQGNDNITVSRIETRGEMLLTSWGIEIVAVRAGRGYIDVMVARDRRVVVPTAALWKRRELPDTAPHYNTSLLLGEREDTGEPLYVNLAHPFGGQPVSGPHMLIAGESGGGKSVLTSNILMELCATNSPEMARIHLIDPKSGVDYSWIEKMPHLDGAIVTDMEDSLVRYGTIVTEMNRRYEDLLGPTRSRDIDAYNGRVAEGDKIPRIYVFHDEMADWMTDDDYRNDVGKMLSRISAKGRAAGVHLVLITQRPDKKAIPGAIKANISTKIALRVSSKVNSNIIIDESGAEQLLGQGHMLAMVGGMNGGPLFAQAPFLDDWDAEIMALALTDAPGGEAENVVTLDKAA